MVLTGIRPAELTDVEVLARFRVGLAIDERPEHASSAAALQAECEEWFASEMAAGSFRAWIAFDAGLPIGTAGYRRLGLMPRLGGPAFEARIHNVYVSSTFRNRGIGEALMRELMADLARDRYTRITLGPRERARSFYERLGFAPSTDMRLPSEK